MARIQCAGCRGKFEVEQSQMGQTTPCPLCDFLLRLPGLQIPPGTIIAGYRIERMIAIGGMGEVYKATQLSMERQVALKLLSPAVTADKEALDDFLREVRMLARLSHPNIVEAIEAGEDNGLHYLSMSYVDGETLENMLEDGPFREREALEIARTVALTLKYAWDKHRMLHRDIKPANIMLDRRGRVALMDLGIAKIVEEGSGGRASIVHGTPQYMSPEQASGYEDLDARADVYSLGATLYHLLTGRDVFPGNDHDAILRQQIHEKPEPPRRINPDLSVPCEALLMGWLAKARGDRPADWDEAIVQLDRVLAKRHPTRTAKPTRPATTSLRMARRRAGTRLKGKDDKKKKNTSARKRSGARSNKRRASYTPAAAAADNKNAIIIGAAVFFMFLLVIIIAASK